MNSTNELVEHFFRHESGRLIALLTRFFGVARLDLVEDVVQSSLLQALQSWSSKGIPDDPAGWLYQTARNRATDALRREQLQARILTEVADGITCDGPAEPLFAEEIGDEPLRLLFLCCHEAIPIESRVAFALRTVCGFSTPEIARGLLTSEANVQKRIVRAKERLRDEPEAWESPGLCALKVRLDAVMATIYLLFNEGYNSVGGELPIRRDLCEEAIRLAKMLANHSVGDAPKVFALVALLEFHSARFDARVSPTGTAILLDEQDRSTWNWGKIHNAMTWMTRSAHGNEASTYHIEAAIAWEHCRAQSFESTDWPRILTLYDELVRISPSAIHVLNYAVAEAHVHGPEAGLMCLESVSQGEIPSRYAGWYAVLGELRFRAGRYLEAEQAWVVALSLDLPPGDRPRILNRMTQCRERLMHQDPSSLPGR